MCGRDVSVAERDALQPVTIRPSFGQQVGKAPAIRARVQVRQLPVAGGLTGLDNTDQRMLVIGVEPNKLVHREPSGQVSHGAFKRPRILPAARRLRFHSFCQVIGCK